MKEISASHAGADNTTPQWVDSRDYLWVTFNRIQDNGIKS